MSLPTDLQPPENLNKRHLSRFGLMALDHWKEFLPKRYQALKEEGTLILEAWTAQELTKDLMVDVMRKGMQHHEALEVALPEWILLPPESDPSEDET